jgi:hypothetical protein
MQLSAPKQVTFWVAVVVALVGLVSSFVAIPVLSGFALWILVLGFIILAAGCMLEGF